MPRLVIERSFTLDGAPSGASQADLVFHVTRGRLLGLPKDFARGQVLDLRENRNGKIARAVVRVGSSKPDDLRRPVPVLTEGEPPELVKIIYRDSAGRRLIEVRGGRAASEGTGVGAAGIENDGENADMPPEQYMEELEASLVPEDTEVQHHRRFFAAFDRRTHGALYAVAEPDEEERRYRDEAIRLIKQDLIERVTERASRWDPMAKGAPVLQHQVHPDHVASFLLYLSKLQLDVLREHYPGPDGTIDIERFEEAFEMFANGELRFRLPSLVVTCQPSSGFFFLFGEFALTAVENGVDAEEWRALANVLVRCQCVFARVYAPASPPPALCRIEDYAASNYDNRRILTAREKARLCDEFRNASIGELALAATRHAGTFLSGSKGPPPLS